MINKLAIIIPAYKATFFRQALLSLANQTCMDFSVYIGDDFSPYHLDVIFDEVRENFSDISYTKFPYNLGSVNLISHWERCFHLIKEEEWFCMFSDDDVVSPNLVEMFYKTLDIDNGYNVYHSNISIIDKLGNIKRVCNKYPKYMSSSMFFKKLYSRKIDARMPEFIFNKKEFIKNGGFKYFDLGICTDNAVVLINATNKGVMTIPGSHVYWRDSNENISSNFSDKSIIRRKELSTYEFLNWTHTFFKQNDLKYPLPFIYKARYVLGSIKRLFNFFDTNTILNDIHNLKFVSDSSSLHYLIKIILKLSKHIPLLHINSLNYKK